MGLRIIGAETDGRSLQKIARKSLPCNALCSEIVPESVPETCHYPRSGLAWCLLLNAPPLALIRLLQGQGTPVPRISSVFLSFDHLSLPARLFRLSVVLFIEGQTIRALFLINLSTSNSISIATASV